MFVFYSLKIRCLYKFFYLFDNINKREIVPNGGNMTSRGEKSTHHKNSEVRSESARKASQHKSLEERSDASKKAASSQSREEKSKAGKFGSHQSHHSSKE